MLFSVGGLFALYEAWHKVQHPEPITDWQWVPIAVLVVAIVPGGLLVPHRDPRVQPHPRAAARGSSFVRTAKAPELPVVLLEDFAALLGLVFALFGVGLTLLTGNGIWDGVGTAIIGLLLVVVAVVLAIEMKSLLLGESATVEQVRAITEALVGEGDTGVDSVIHLRTMHLGPEELLVAAKIAVGAKDYGHEIAAAIDAAERRVREASPGLTVLLYLEPDIDRGAAPPGELGAHGAARPVSGARLDWAPAGVGDDPRSAQMGYAGSADHTGSKEFFPCPSTTRFAT